MSTGLDQYFQTCYIHFLKEKLTNDHKLNFKFVVMFDSICLYNLVNIIELAGTNSIHINPRPQYTHRKPISFLFTNGVKKR